MAIQIKRIYEKPEKSDGVRILVDRLWPRGISREEAHIDLWAKELAPGDALRKWFHDNKEERYAEFVKRYKKELLDNKGLIQKVMQPYKSRHFTLITAVKDIEHSHLPALSSFLENLQ